MRFAIFGGTFDPIHNAHLAVAREALRKCELDYVLFIPAGNPPHKQGMERTPFEHRAWMVNLAIADEPRFMMSRMEQGSERSYSIHTVEKLQREHPEDEIYFLIGADAFADIRTWHRWEELIRMVTFLVVTRPGAKYDVPEGARVVPLEGLNLRISSSEIRGVLKKGRVTLDIPPAVLNYVRENGLYDSPY